MNAALFFTLHVLVDLFIFMKSNLQYTCNNNSDYLFTKVFSRLFYTSVLSSSTDHLPVYRQCASHTPAQLILCFRDSLMYSHVQFVFPRCYFLITFQRHWHRSPFFGPFGSSGTSTCPLRPLCLLVERHNLQQCHGACDTISKIEAVQFMLVTSNCLSSFGATRRPYVRR